ncbi:sensor histidine kinase [Bacteroidota bacterium]
MPSLFGGISGIIIGYMYIRLKLSFSEKLQIKSESEKNLQKLNENLENLIEERTNRLIAINQELKKSEKNLIELNSTKDKFFSIIAHDLKNPLGSFKQTTEVLSMDFENLSDDDKKEYIQSMDKSAKQLFELLENLLTWSRSQRGKISFDPVETDISYVINNTVSLLNFQAANKNISLECNGSESNIGLFDANMISTVIRNLISNAIKFTPEGGTIKIGSGIEDDLLTAWIQDSGIGISKDNQAKLFRLDSTHTTQGTANETGTGLGLILCKEFIEKNGGEIWVESEEGKGSTFFFTVPKA